MDDRDKLHWCWKCATAMTEADANGECSYWECPLRLALQRDQQHSHVLDWLLWVGA